METTTTLTLEEQKLRVRDAVAEFINFANAEGAKYFAARYPLLEPPVHTLDGGRKYLRIVTENSVHCFVDAVTGGVYKAATFHKPALNGERYNLLDEDSFEELKRNWDPHGSYLYSHFPRRAVL